MSESQRDRDRELGMDREITRRDFLDGVAVTVGGPGAGRCRIRTAGRLRIGRQADAADATAGELSARSHGPAGPNGRRASRPAHAPGRQLLGAAGSPRDTGESYDLVVVGGGISGLAAAYFYSRQNPERPHPGARQPRRLRRPRAAKRVHARGQRIRPPADRLRRHGVDRHALASISPRPWPCSRTSASRLERFYKYFDRTASTSASGWSTRCEVLRQGDLGSRPHRRDATRRRPTAETEGRAAWPRQAKRDLVMIYHDPKDWLPGLSRTRRRRSA